MTHPSSTEIEGFVSGAIAPPAELIRHVSECEACAEAVRAVAVDEAALYEAAAVARFCAGCGGVAAHERCGHCGAMLHVRQYRIDGLLASGPLGRVYAATDPSGMRVAVKELAFVGPPNQEAMAAFEREARVLERLAHPGIPRFVDSFSEGRGVEARAYLVQELIEGESLARRMDRHQITEGEVIEIARQVLEILVYLQSLSPVVFHRDIKPANLIRRPDGSIALVDFGAARDVGSTSGATIVGTFGYMPVEQLAGIVDATTDLHALGSTLWHLLTRIEPWRLWAEPLLLRRANVSAALRRFLDRLVAREQKRRFSGARAAGDAHASLGIARWTRRWSLAAAAAGLAALATAGGVTLAHHRGAAVGSARVDHVRASGFLAAAHPKTVRAPVAGTLGPVEVQMGQRITEDQLLTRIGSATEYVQQLRLDTARLKEAEAEWRGARGREQRDKAAVKRELAEADVAEARRALANSELRSPQRGTVLEVLAHEAEKVAEGAPILRIADLSDMTVELDVGEEDLRHLRLGQGARIVVDAADHPYRGRITLIGAEVDKARGTILAVVLMSDPDDQIHPGMSATVSFDHERDPQHPTNP